MFMNFMIHMYTFMYAIICLYVFEYVFSSYCRDVCVCVLLNVEINVHNNNTECSGSVGFTPIKVYFVNVLVFKLTQVIKPNGELANI